MSYFYIYLPFFKIPTFTYLYLPDLSLPVTDTTGLGGWDGRSGMGKNE